MTYFCAALDSLTTYLTIGAGEQNSGTGGDNGDTAGETEPVFDPGAAELRDVTGSGRPIKVPFLVNNFRVLNIQTTITWDDW